MKFGVAKDIISPDIRMGMSGYGSRYNKDFKDIHDDLYVRCLYTENGDDRLLMVVYDLAFHDFCLTTAVREYISEKYGLTADQLVLSYTHTHAATAIKGFSPGEHKDEYEDMLLARTKSCIDRCMLNMYEGSVSFCQIEGDWNINRRKLVNGKLVGGPYPEGLTDKTMNLLKFADNDGIIRALLFNYACHPVTLGDTYSISAEYPGRVCEILQGKYYGLTPLFFQGAGAHERPKITFNGHRFFNCSFDHVNEMAQQIAARIESALVTGQFMPIDFSPKAKAFEINVPIKPHSKEDLQQRLQKSVGFMANAIQAVLAEYDSTPDYLPLRGGVIKLNDDVYMAWLTGEVIVEVKNIIHKAIGEDKKLIFIGYADSIGYIPDSTVIEQGGYEGGDSMLGFARKGVFTPEIDQILYDAFKETKSKI
jgi:neutral ceramidase